MFEPKDLHGDGYAHYQEAENYYTQQESAFSNTFNGRLAKAMEIGDYSTDTFTAYLRGEYPKFETIQKQSAFKTRERKARSAMELNFAPPKSVSIHGLLFGDKGCILAHREATEAATRFIEDNLLYYRLSLSKLRELEAQGVAIPPYAIVDRRAGMARVKATDGALWTSVTHTLSRLNLTEDSGGDPQIHNHQIMANHTLGCDGKLHTIDFGEVYRNQHLIGAVYTAHLRAALERQGKRVEDTQHAFELEGYIRGDIEIFSDGRCKRIPEFIDAENLRRSDPGHPCHGMPLQMDEAGHRQFANSATRGGKLDMRDHSRKTDGTIDPLIGMDAARAWWKFKAAESGLDVDALRMRVAAAQTGNGCAKQENDAGLTIDQVYQAAVEHLTERSSTIRSRGELLRQMLQFSHHRFMPAELDAVIDARLNTGDLVWRLDRKSLTTQTRIHAETRIRERYLSGLGTQASLANDDLFDECLQRFLTEKGFSNLTDGQVRAARGIVQSTDRLTVVVGDAGTGKSTSMELVRGIAEVKGVRVAGMAPSGKAMDALADALVPKEETKRANTPGVLSVQSAIRDDQWWQEKILPGTLIVLDEAGLVGAEEMRTLLNKVEQYDARIAIVGDPEQFKSVSAGSSMHYLVELAGEQGRVLRLDEMIRARDEETRRLHYEARDNPETALVSLFETGRLVQIDDEAARLQEVAQRYGEIPEPARDNTFVITGTNADRRKVNAAIRRRLGFEHQKSIEFNSFERRDLTKAELRQATNYQIGDTIKFNIGCKPFRKGEAVQVVERNGRILIVERTILDADGNERKVRLDFEPWTQSSAISLGDEERMQLCVGERVRFTAAIGKHITNGERGIVKSIDFARRKAIVRLADSGKEVGIRLRDQGLGLAIRYGYAATGHSSQGGTARNGGQVLIYAPADDATISHNSFYTNVTRSVQGARGLQFFTDAIGADHVQSLMKKAGTKLPQDRAMADVEVRLPVIENAFCDAGGLRSVFAGGRASQLGKKDLIEKLLEAQAQFGKQIGLRGSVPFKKKVVRAAVESGLHITFLDKVSSQFMKTLLRQPSTESAPKVVPENPSDAPRERMRVRP